MKNQEFLAFRRQVQGPGSGKHYKVTGSWGIYDCYKLLRKEGWQGVGRPLKEGEFYGIIRKMNSLLAQEIGEGRPVVFPSHMGKLEIRKFNPTAFFKDGKLKLTYPVNWDETLKLWFTDDEARAKKILIRFTDPIVFTVKYTTTNAYYPNKGFYEFAVNNKIKQLLKKNIQKGIIETAYNIKQVW